MSEDVYGLLPYESMWRKQARDRSLNEARNFVYAFKARGRNRDLVEALVRAAAAVLGCEQIIAIPSSEAKENQLQRIFGMHISTTGQTDKAKYLNGRKDYSSWPLRFRDDIKRAPTLLVDDVVASGGTMDYFAAALKTRMGLHVIKFAVGISTSREYRESDIAISLDQKIDEVEDILDLNIEDVDFSTLI